MAVPQSSFIAVLGVVKRRSGSVPEIGRKLKMDLIRGSFATLEDLA
jgi:hypothetical protein